MRSLLVAAVLFAAAPAAAVVRVDINSGTASPLPVAVPAFPATAEASTAAGSTGALGGQVAGVIAADLASSGLFRAVDASVPVAAADVTAPRFDAWRATPAQALVTGNVTANPDGGITVGCYAYDVVSSEELARQGFVTTAANWRRAAHKCADLVYSRLTGETGYFDSRIVYVSETGPKTKRIKRLAVMDQDGANHRFLTNGQNLVLTPRFAPSQQTLTYMSFADNRPRIWIYTIGTGHQDAVGDTGNMSSAPRFSPDGGSLVYSISQNGTTDIYKMALASRSVVRLTHGPGISTAPSFSPDGSKIVFESDRGGGQQVYVMNADGSDQRRISFGDGRTGTPVWSPRGDLIAFTRLAGGSRFRIGVMRPDGSGERLLTDGHQDEGPTWSPNGRVIMFFRTGGRTTLHSVDLSGTNERTIKTPLDASDPAWSPLLP